MNELTILMHLLSEKTNNVQIGATKEEVLKKLNLYGKNESVYFHNLITHLSSYIEPLGLQIRFNPLSSHWYIAFETTTSEFLSANPFENKPRLAATIFCVLICCLKDLGRGKIQDIKEIRRKKHIIEDLKELEKLGYLELEEDLGIVSLTPLIGYQLDLNMLLVKLALKIKDQK
ncbi:MAG: hypothetical protein ACXADU_11850 [Promethearchaeota archaeon]|jgi:hypothetical protein